MPVIAQLLINVGADIGSAMSKLTDVENRMNGFSSKAFGTALAGTGVAIAAGLAHATNTAADFEQSIADVKAIMSPADIQQFGAGLEQLALQLGQGTRFSAIEAAQGIQELVKAGVSVSAVLGGAAQAALDLSAATGIPVADSAIIASQAMNAYKKDVSELGNVVDTLARTANASAADMAGLKLGLSAVGSVAPLVGLSFEDTTAALGLFANNALIGSDAGTSFKTMLLGLQPQTKKEAALFRELGLEFFDSTGHVKNLTDIAGQLHDTLSGLTPKDQEAKLQALFGTDAIRAAGILLREGADGISKFKGEMATSNSAAQSAAIRMNTLKGSLETLRGTFERVEIAIGKAFLPAVRQLSEGLTRVLTSFVGLSPEVQTFAAAGLAAAAAVLTLAGGFILLAPLIAALLSPIGLVVLAIAGLALAWATNMGDIQGKTGAVVDLIMAKWGEISPFLGNLFSFFTSLWVLELTVAERAMREIAGFFETILLPAFEQVRGWMNDHILGPFVQLLKDIQAIMDQIFPSGAGANDATARLLASQGIDLGATQGAGTLFSAGIREGDLALANLSQGISAGGPGSANNVIVNLNNPTVPDQTVAERFAAEVKEQVMWAIIEAERGSTVPPPQALPGVPF